MSSDRIVAALARPQTVKALAKALGMGRPAVRGLRRTLGELVREGRVAKMVGSRYVAQTRPQEDEEDGREPRRGRRAARPATGRRVGLVRRRAGQAWVAPYRESGRWRLALDPDDASRAPDGYVVVVEPRGPARAREAARLIEVLGPAETADVDVRAVATELELPVEFPPQVLAEAEHAAALGVPAAEVTRREDLRREHTVTIDGADARDFDDAVAVSRLPGGGFRLRVSIADVSFYVTPDSALDREALRRGNSVYFPDRAIPMLPAVLSSGICSLRPREERLAMTVELEFDAHGARLAARSFASVIRSAARLTYAEVASFLGKDEPAWLEPMHALARILHARRLREGSIDFDLPEPEVVLDRVGRVLDVRRRVRNFAHRLIEEFMLEANRAVAERLDAAEAPAIYRVHEPPRRTDLRELSRAFEALGIRLAGTSAREIGTALRRVHGRREATALHVQMLRAMRQARYETANGGHFALAFDHYLHFTSPIRRYADLVVHRSLKALLGAGSAPALRGLEAVATRVSERERAAIDAERRIVNIYRARLMQEHVGGEYSGTVSGVARFGVFVTLDAHFVDGLLPGRALGEGLELDPSGLAASGRRSGRRYAIGDAIRVRVAAVDALRARIDLEPEGRAADVRPRAERARASRRGVRRARTA